ncbi:acyltransferase [Sphingomonas sp. MMS24-J13]|uniref:acyltransferase n=1 Tax=Sphingomonas sp. MMS24-J13 TaxID=3238686 RepID=UPI00384E5DD5
MTRFVSTAWVERGSAEFEAGAALRVHATARRATPEQPLHIYVLAGYDKLEEPYLAHLRAAHIHLYDATTVMADVTEEYLALNEFANPYNVKCFLRWFVIERMCPGERLIHIDLDLFFRPDLNEVSRILAECEGTLGSPCITIATPEWLRVYRVMVDRLISDRPALEAELDFGGTTHRRNIASDQDLTQALERRKGILPQTLRGIGNWAILNNPLWGPQVLGRPTTYTSDDDFGGKPVLFWHLQNNFADYLARLALIQTFPYPRQEDAKVRLAYPDFHLSRSPENLAFYLLKVQGGYVRLQQRWRDETAMTLPNTGNQFELLFTRAWVAQAFIVEGRFREIFSDDWWWDETAFVKASPSEIAEKQNETAAAPTLPANVFVSGDVSGNTIIIEPSDRHVALAIEVRGTGNTVIVRRDCALEAMLVACGGAHIEIGEQTEMNGVHIHADEGSRCTIGARCRFSRDVRIQLADAYQVFDAETGQRINAPRPIHIEDDVWIGEYVQVSKGCIIGSGSAVKAASVLDGDYPGGALIAGNPAKVVHAKIKWKTLDGAARALSDPQHR